MGRLYLSRSGSGGRSRWRLGLRGPRGRCLACRGCRECTWGSRSCSDALHWVLGCFPAAASRLRAGVRQPGEKAGAGGSGIRQPFADQATPAMERRRKGRLTSSHYFSGVGWWRLPGMSWSRATGGIPFEFLRNRGRAAPCFLVQQRHTRVFTP